MSSRNDLLMVFHGLIPFPLRAHGVSMRYLPIIQYLSERHTIDLILVVDQKEISEELAALRRYCRDVFRVEPAKPRRLNGARNLRRKMGLLLPWKLPIHWVPDDACQVMRRITSLTSAREYHSVLCVGAYAVITLPPNISGRRVFDFIDSPFLTQQRKVLGERGPSLLHGYECWRARRWERKLIRRSTASIFVSSVDARAVSCRKVDQQKKHVIPNGISLNGYSPAVHDDVRSPNIGFLGNMGYLPNIQAVHWLYEHVFLALRAEIQDLSLYIIGRNPVESVQRLARNQGVTVTGAVEDIWPYVNAIDVFVFPIWKGAGLKNKILEALYAKRPVVTTRIGNEGIGALDRRELLICGSAAEFCEAARRLLSAPDERRSLGEAGHRLVTHKFSWPRILREFESVLIDPEGQQVDDEGNNGARINESIARLQVEGVEVPNT